MGWLSAIGSFFSAIASALGLANKVADASKTSADQQSGVTSQVATDRKVTNDVLQAELAATSAAAAGPSDSSLLHDGSA